MRVYTYIYICISFHPWKQDGLPEKRWFLRPFRVYFFFWGRGQLDDDLAQWPHAGAPRGCHRYSDNIPLTPAYWWTHWGLMGCYHMLSRKTDYTYDIFVSENIQIHKYRYPACWSLSPGAHAPVERAQESQGLQGVCDLSCPRLGNYGSSHCCTPQQGWWMLNLKFEHLWSICEVVQKMRRPPQIL